MENNINEWTELWSQQKADNLDVDLLTKQLTKLDRITTFQKLFFLLVTIFSMYSMLTHLSKNIFNTTAIILILLGFLIILVPLFENKPNFKIESTNQFIENQIKYLKKKLLIPKVYILIFIILFVLALNIAFLGAFSELRNSTRIFFHFSTFILFIILFVARNKGVKNYQKKIFPLIEKLKQIKNQE
ncbi:hypothetical protein MC378_13810 [Polaribacter sp. MSW13]|uniref:Uncharacterized protein n=1 Tax=Polaribacter marinus TaxID=2916838 RepID=A0A9X2ANT4_9FLAO|nr:hypothetical protein [Polaribacter marinus]MCI2230249.1 hypothetical protein [Polaribacter marinus]